MRGAIKVSYILLLAWMLLAGCTPEAKQQETSAITIKQQVSLCDLNNHSASQEEKRLDIRWRSCPQDTPDLPYQTFDIEFERVKITSGLDDKSRLAFRGALHLTSSNPTFGGLSGLETLNEYSPANRLQRLIAVSDEGTLFEFSLELDEAGTLIGVHEGTFAPIRGETGAYLSGKKQSDAESLAISPYGMLMIGFERDHRIGYMIPKVCSANARMIVPTPWILSEAPIPDNKGLEAITYVNIPSSCLNSETLLTAFEVRIDGETPVWTTSVYASFDAGFQNEKRHRLGLEVPRGFGVTGMDSIDGDVYMLQRSYNPVTGNRINIVRHKLNEENLWNIPTNAPATPDHLATLQRPFPVDNFEGITATRLPDGTLRLYIISDNNFSDRQRTLLMAFDLLQDESP